MCVRPTIFLAAVLCCLLGCSGARPAPLGLVLSGGGAKGAYEVGVWRAICELGLDKRITVISGTSVGAINATIFATVQDSRRCSELWTDVSQRAFRPNFKTIGAGVQRTIDDVDELKAQMQAERRRRIRLIERRKGRRPTPEELEKIDGDLALESGASMGLSLLLRTAETVATATSGNGRSQGVCDSETLRRELTGCLPEKWPSPAPQVYATAVDKNTSQATVFALRGLPRADVVERIMASAAIPGAFDTVVIDGVPYVDGGFESKGGDNVPIRPVIERNPEIRTVIVVTLGSKTGIPSASLPENIDGVKLVTITPSEDIAGSIGGWQGVFDVSESKREHMYSLGYADARRALSGL